MDLRERLARAACKAEKPPVNPDKVIDRWSAVRDRSGYVTKLEFNPWCEWHQRLPIVDAVIREAEAAGFVLAKLEGKVNTQDRPVDSHEG